MPTIGDFRFYEHDSFVFLKCVHRNDFWLLNVFQFSNHLIKQSIDVIVNDISINDFISRSRSMEQGNYEYSSKQRNKDFKLWMKKINELRTNM